MRHTNLCRVAIFALMGASCFRPAAAREWTLEDILLAPELRSIAIAAHGHNALYVTRVADLQSNKTVASLRSVNLDSGETRELRRAAWIDDLRRVPGTADWSARMDLGQGVQLYRISASGNIEQLLAHPATVVFGDTEGGMLTANSHAPLKVGIQAYSWSPDGKWLWYVALDAEPEKPVTRFDADVVAERGRRRIPGRATVNLYLRGPGGETSVVARRPSTDRIALHYGHDVVWSAKEVRFRLEENDATGRSEFVTMAWSFADKRASKVEGSDAFPYWMLTGPHGGRLAAEGVGNSREIVEHDEGAGRHSYGQHGFSIGDGRGIGAWRSPDGARTLVGTRTIANPRYGLARVHKRGLDVIESDLSLTRCDFTADLEKGACLAEAQAVPPVVVAVDVAARKVRRVASLSKRHEGIIPLAITPRLWTNRFGDKATGYIIWPRGYRKGLRYPAIVVTHGTDADERFLSQMNQWEYPVQVFAERGYVVLLVNDPTPRQNADFAAAWESGSFDRPLLSPEKMRELLWLRSVTTFEDAVGTLVAEGVIDPGRVGIAGYSRGSQVTNVAMTQSRLFRAASSGDGGFLEPSGFADGSGIYDLIFGGSPYDNALPAYQALSPSLRAEKACGAILQQNANPFSGSVDFYRALRKAGVPAQITLYPGEDMLSDETHVFHIPANRLAAMQENIAWFDYWLLGKRDPASPAAARYAEWDRMRNAMPARCLAGQSR